MKKLRIVLNIIDGQNCFMQLPGAPLPVPGSIEDMTRLIQFILTFIDHIELIICSLDTHVPDHISHAERWIDKLGNHPEPFTVITFEEFSRGVWRAANPEDEPWQGEYLKRLTRPHIIWPVHGQKPTWEWQLFQELLVQLKKHPNVRYVEKGMHREVEQFGVFGADVPFLGSPETEINRVLIDEINQYDLVIFAGEAASHCVMDSVKQFLAHIPSTDWSKVVLLEDCMSPIQGFEQLTADWFAEMRAKGVKVIKTSEFRTLLSSVQ